MRNRIDEELRTIYEAAHNAPTKRQKRTQTFQKVSNWLLGFCIAGIMACCLFAFGIAMICTIIDLIFGTQIGPKWNQ